jgi:hypothetical protein
MCRRLTDVSLRRGHPVSTPIGHAIVGLALARRLGARSPVSLGTAVVVANLADADILLGILLHHDPWRLHRRRTHTPAFALGAGAVLGASGLIKVDRGVVRRSLFANALTGAIVACSHLVLDDLSRPQFSAKRYTPRPLRRQVAGMSIASWLVDVIGCGAIACAIWPRTRRSADSEEAYSRSLGVNQTSY